MISHFFKLARPHQYTKNFFIFIPAFFAFQITNVELMTQALLAFISFSLLASAVYVLNDWVDREEDAAHPTKCKRPIASGKINTLQAFLFLSFLLVMGFGLAYSLSTNLLYLVVGYVIMNLFYSFKLKHVAIIDIVIIAVGFVIRLFVGSESTGVDLSQWIIVMTFLLALFLALAKRRDDVLIFLSTQQKMRKVIDGYNLKFLDAAMMMTATIVILAYILWSISAEVVSRIGSENLYLTALFVVLGILRYLQISLVEEKSGNPSKILLKDRFIQATLAGWLGTFAWILYLG
jgi:decaprenyl-phosphate phosphoribosyltransferase